MTGTDFLRLLEQPRLLYELPSSELQQLAMRFPYSANLRLLLLLKSHLDGHPEEATYLARCAAATFDRTSIYDVLRELDVLPNASLEEEGEFLELKELDDLVLDALRDQPAQVELAEELPAPVNDFVSGWDEEELSTAAETGETEDYLQAVPPPVSTSNDPEDIMSQPEPAQVEPHSVSQAQPPQKANLTGYGTLRQRLARIRQRQRAAGFEEKEDVNRIARRSLVAQEVVASETLAKLLIRQGQYQHAIKMYQRLILLYPEKKTTFAGLIKDLKEKL